MTADEIIDLLTLVAAGDKRTIGHADVEVWLAVAEDAGSAWTYDRARRALREHRRDSTEYVMPAHIHHRITAARKVARSKFAEDLPPRELGDDVRAELAWRKRRADEWVGHALDEWARTGVVPKRTPRVELEPPHRRQVAAAVATLSQRWKAPDTRPRRQLGPLRDPDRLAQAQAELDVVRARSAAVQKGQPA